MTSAYEVQPPDEETQAGYVALLGYPNVGKSSLLNRLVEQKLSIVTPLPQTTRERVLGIDTREGVQIVFIDTPGLVEPRYLLQSSMLHSALEAIRDVDVVLLLIDPLQPLPLDEAEPFLKLSSQPRRVVVAINKVDVAERHQIEAVEKWADGIGFTHVVRISAETGAGTDQLRQRIRELLPLSPYLYPPDEISAQPVRFFAAELVRESIFELYKDEIPYSVAVKVEEFRESSLPIYIRSTVFVERPSQKGILIGAAGSAIRSLGELSRRKIEKFLDAPVYLDLWVKVLPRWRKDSTSLRNLGYRLPPKSHD